MSIGLVLALVVGGFVVAAHSYGDQKQEPADNNQTNIVIDYFDPAETAQLQTFRKPDFVMESESGCWGPFCTEQGSIDFYAVNLPDCLPLCMTTENLANYYVDVVVYGGYTPWEMGSYIDVYQKYEYKGTINVLWTPFEGSGDCCATFYHATFYVDVPFCLESSQYPAVNDPWDINFAPGDTIPGKEVCLSITTYWTGCRPHEQPSQDFTIIHSHSHQAFSKCDILTLKTHTKTHTRTHTLCKHLDHKQSALCHTQTALVQDIFEPKITYNGGVRIG